MQSNYVEIWILFNFLKRGYLHRCAAESLDSTGLLEMWAPLILQTTKHEFLYIWKARKKTNKPKKQKTRACARCKKSRRDGNEAGWCWTAGRRAACKSRAECLHRTERCPPQRTAVFGTTHGDVPQHQVQQDTSAETAPIRTPLKVANSVHLVILAFGRSLLSMWSTNCRGSKGYVS